MGWEKRPGGCYYYKKVRRGKHVSSEYVGAGAMAHAVAEQVIENRLGRKLERNRRKREREESTQIDRMLASRERSIQTLLRGFLVAHGYHTHRGQWRKRRDVTKGNSQDVSADMQED